MQTVDIAQHHSTFGIVREEGDHAGPEGDAGWQFIGNIEDEMLRSQRNPSIQLVNGSK